MQENSIEYLSYDESVFGSATTRNGCSFCLGLASLPWSVGFGMANPLPGAAVSVAFLLLSEAIC